MHRPNHTVALTLASVALVTFAAPAKALQNGLARTPPMGWNSWYTAHCGVTEDVVLRNARALADTGMARLGYRYVNVDGCWEGRHRDRKGRLHGDKTRFPHGMAALGRAIHALGLRYGIYTSAGPTICSHDLPGSQGHYGRDMKTFARWGVDYVKVDWCAVPHGSDPRHVYAAVARAAARSGRRMLVTVSMPGTHEPWTWAAAYGNTWRIAADANGRWSGVMAALDVDAPLYRYAGPGGWNDPDILQVGDGVLTRAEERAHFSLWSMLAAPLLAGYDLRAMPSASRDVLESSEVIAVDQDRLGRQGRRVRRRHHVETWVRKLSHRATAVLVLNRSSRTRSATVRLASVPGLPKASAYVARELWTGETAVLGPGGKLRATLPRHGVAMWRITPSSTG
jgi:alpha-galactosidase